MRRTLVFALLASSLVVMGCTADLDDAAGASEELLDGWLMTHLRCTATLANITLSGPEERAAFKRGCELFFEETFGGNGRTCGSCHLNEILNGDPTDNNFDFTPENAQALFDKDPTHPLFRPIDSDDGAGEDYTMLLAHGLARVRLELPPNVTVDETDSPLVHVDPVTGRTTVTVLRSTPSVENVRFEERLMWDGRAQDDLPAQAIDAVKTHFEASRLPTEQEAEDLATFQKHLFTNQTFRRYAKNGIEPELPRVPPGKKWESERRGREFFVSQPVLPDAPVRGGHCATCHSGPMLDTTNEFNPVQAANQTFGNNFVSETNMANPAFPPGTRVGIQLPELTYRITLQYDVVMPDDLPFFGIPAGTPLFPAGTVFTLRSSDPGSILVTGDPCELVAACLINSDPENGIFSTTSFFRTTSLWASADTAPYFHDNSATNLEELMELYRTLFLVTAVGTENPAWILTPQEEEDIIAYMNFAFRRDRDLLP